MNARREREEELSRRELMKQGLRMSGYAAPLIIASALPMSAGAVTGTPTPTLTSTPTPMPMLRVNPTTGPLGSTFTITGTGFPPGATVFLVLLNTNTGRFTFVPVTTDPSGAITTTLNSGTDPLIAVTGPGPYAVVATLTMPTATTFTGEVARAPFTITPLPQATSFLQDFVLTGAAPNTTFSVFFEPSNVATFTPAGSLTTDAFGVGSILFPVTVDPSVVTSIQIVATVPGQPPTNPVGPPTTSNIVTVLAGMNGLAPAPILVGFIVQEPVLYLVDVGIFNTIPGVAFDIFIQPNGTGTPTRVTALTTNSQGNATAIVPVTLTGGPATSFTLTAVLAGSLVTGPSLTRVVSGVNVVTAAAVMARTPESPQGHTLQVSHSR